MTFHHTLRIVCSSQAGSTFSSHVGRDDLASHFFGSTASFLASCNKRAHLFLSCFSLQDKCFCSVLSLSCGFAVWLQGGSQTGLLAIPGLLQQNYFYNRMRASLFSALLFAFNKVVRLESSCFNTGTVSFIFKESSAEISNGYDLPVLWPLPGNLHSWLWWNGQLLFCSNPYLL